MKLYLVKKASNKLYTSRQARSVRQQSPRLSAQVEAILAAMDVLPLEAPVDEQYARLRLHLEHMGTPIGPNDMLQAAQALAENATLVSANTNEFHRVPGLMCVN